MLLNVSFPYLFILLCSSFHLFIFFFGLISHSLIIVFFHSLILCLLIHYLASFESLSLCLIHLFVHSFTHFVYFLSNIHFFFLTRSFNGLHLNFFLSSPSFICTFFYPQFLIIHLFFFIHSFIGLPLGHFLVTHFCFCCDLIGRYP